VFFEAFIERRIETAVESDGFGFQMAEKAGYAEQGELSWHGWQPVNTQKKSCVIKVICYL